MSTTVTYEGSTIATVSNNTKTLATAGTWLEGDITLTDVTDRIATKTVAITSSANSISFSVLGRPTALTAYFAGKQSNGSSRAISSTTDYKRPISVTYDGSNCTAVYLDAISSGLARVASCTYAYSNGTVTITSSGLSFIGDAYGYVWNVIYSYRS